MATVNVSGGRLEVRLRRWERVTGVHGDVSVPVSEVRAARVAASSLGAMRGLRSPGLAVPGLIAIGTWRRRPGHSAFVYARRGLPAVVVELQPGARPNELILATPHARAIAESLRSAAGLAHARPAEAREVQVTIGADGPALVGTLCLPQGIGPHPGVLLLTGSGPLDRDSNAPGLALGIGRDLAAALAAAGIASLRFDKRGVGASEGSFLEAGLHDNADDAQRALAWLRGHPEIRDDALFLAGHSEGAWTAALVAARPGESVAGVVLLAAGARTGEDLLAWQTRRVAAGLPPAARLPLRALRIDLADRQAANVERLKATTRDVHRMGGRRINARWHRELIAFDPRAALVRLDMPVLAITGAKDIQVDPGDLDAIAAIVPGPVEIERIPELTHVLRRDSGPASLSAYRRLVRRPVDAELLDRVTGWISRRAACAGARG